MVLDVTLPFASLVTAVDVVPPLCVGVVVVTVVETRLPVDVVVTAVDVVTPLTEGGSVVVVTILPFGRETDVSPGGGGSGAVGLVIVVIVCVGGGTKVGILTSELLFGVIAMRDVLE